MPKVQLATQIKAEVKGALEEVCNDRGIKIGHFVEEAIIDKIEELEDIADLKKIRAEKSRPLSAVIKDLEKSGKV